MIDWAFKVPSLNQPVDNEIDLLSVGLTMNVSNMGESSSKESANERNYYPLPSTQSSFSVTKEDVNVQTLALTSDGNSTFFEDDRCLSTSSYNEQSSKPPYRQNEAEMTSEKPTQDILISTETTVLSEVSRNVEFSQLLEETSTEFNKNSESSNERKYYPLPSTHSSFSVTKEDVIVQSLALTSDGNSTFFENDRKLSTSTYNEQSSKPPYRQYEADMTSEKHTQDIPLSTDTTVLSEVSRNVEFSQLLEETSTEFNKNSESSNERKYYPLPSTHSSFSVTKEDVIVQSLALTSDGNSTFFENDRKLSTSTYNEQSSKPPYRQYEADMTSEKPTQDIPLSTDTTVLSEVSRNVEFSQLLEETSTEFNKNSESSNERKYYPLPSTQSSFSVTKEDVIVQSLALTSDGNSTFFENDRKLSTSTYNEQSSKPPYRQYEADKTSEKPTQDIPLSTDTTVLSEVSRNVEFSQLLEETSTEFNKNSESSNERKYYPLPSTHSSFSVTKEDVIVQSLALTSDGNSTFFENDRKLSTSTYNEQSSKPPYRQYEADMTSEKPTQDIPLSTDTTVLSEVSRNVEFSQLLEETSTEFDKNSSSETLASELYTTEGQLEENFDRDYKTTEHVIESFLTPRVITANTDSQETLEKLGNTNTDEYTGITQYFDKHKNTVSLIENSSSKAHKAFDAVTSDSTSEVGIITSHHPINGETSKKTSRVNKDNVYTLNKTGSYSTNVYSEHIQESIASYSQRSYLSSTTPNENKLYNERTHKPSSLWSDNEEATQKRQTISSQSNTQMFASDVEASPSLNWNILMTKAKQHESEITTDHSKENDTVVKEQKDVENLHKTVISGITTINPIVSSKNGDTAMPVSQIQSGKEFIMSTKGMPVTAVTTNSLLHRVTSLTLLTEAVRPSHVASTLALPQLSRPVTTTETINKLDEVMKSFTTIKDIFSTPKEKTGEFIEKITENLNLEDSTSLYPEVSSENSSLSGYKMRSTKKHTPQDTKSYSSLDTEVSRGTFTTRRKIIPSTLSDNTSRNSVVRQQENDHTIYSDENILPVNKDQDMASVYEALDYGNTQGSTLSPTSQRHREGTTKSLEPKFSQRPPNTIFDSLSSKNEMVPNSINEIKDSSITAVSATKSSQSINRIEASQSDDPIEISDTQILIIKNSQEYRLVITEKDVNSLKKAGKSSYTVFIQSESFKKFQDYTIDRMLSASEVDCITTFQVIVEHVNLGDGTYKNCGTNEEEQEGAFFELQEDFNVTTRFCHVVSNHTIESYADNILAKLKLPTSSTVDKFLVIFTVKGSDHCCGGRFYHKFNSSLSLAETLVTSPEFQHIGRTGIRCPFIFKCVPTEPGETCKLKLDFLLWEHNRIPDYTNRTTSPLNDSPVQGTSKDCGGGEAYITVSACGVIYGMLSKR
ncbi:hypothetical protein SK128_002226 [Halocaridina rubra]|uniref:Uncharacterized protein n=1 Tax=Halocaridina rubra TaxID=373956 RepID=A0AAN8XCW0_HALRR